MLSPVSFHQHFQLFHGLISTFGVDGNGLFAENIDLN